MKKLLIAALVVATVVTLFPTMAFAKNNNGNLAPTGAHETINIIGVNNPKTDYTGGGNGNAIFVDRNGSTQFYVSGANNFAILDHNGTDGVVGQAGNPGQPGLTFPYSDGVWHVSIWVRLLGPNNTNNTVGWVSAYWDGSTYVNWANFTLNKQDNAKFSLKTGDLLKDGYDNILWTLDTGTMFRLCQLRIFVD